MQVVRVARSVTRQERYHPEKAVHLSVGRRIPKGMKLRLLTSFVLVGALAIFSGSGATAAGTKTWMKAGKTYTISVTASDGSVYKITGTKKKIEIALARLEKKAAALAAAAATADSCRTNLCVNKIVNATTGEVTEVAFTEAEIAAREAATLANATRQIELASAARAKFSSVGATDVLGIPISVNGSSMTLTGTADELTSRVAELQRAAVEAEAAMETDPCAAGGCTKTIVDLHWGNAPATTTVLPLSAEDLAQRARDRAAAATQARAVADAAAGAVAEPILSLSINTPNQGFGTSGTRSQLEATVRDLEQRAAEAAANANNGCNSCFDRIVDLHWGLAPQTVTDVPFSPERMAQYQADAAANAARAAELASAARAALDAVPVP